MIGLQLKYVVLICHRTFREKLCAYENDKDEAYYGESVRNCLHLVQLSLEDERRVRQANNDYSSCSTCRQLDQPRVIRHLGLNLLD